MPIGGPMAMPFTWSFYYPPPYAPMRHPFGPHGPHTLHPMAFASGAMPHPPPYGASTALPATDTTAAGGAANAAALANGDHAAAAQPGAGEDTAAQAAAPAVAPPVEQRREYRAQPVKAVLANGAGEPPLPEAEPHEAPPEPPVSLYSLISTDDGACLGKSGKSSHC